MKAEALKKAAVAALEDIKAKDIAVLNVKKLTSVTDYMIVASGDSARQVKALADNVVEKIKEGGGEVLGIEGGAVGEWVLVDLGDVIVHVMHPAVREHYNLEELWTAPKLPRKKVAAEEP